MLHGCQVIFASVTATGFIVFSRR